MFRFYRNSHGSLATIRICTRLPVWDLRSTPNIDQSCKHVALAQQSGLPANDSGDGTVLTRIISDTAIATRRNITCGGVTGPRTGGRSCDEYPMASTKDGGGNGVGAGVAHTFPQSLRGIWDSGITELGDPALYRDPGYSVCLIPAVSQNSRAGSLQSWFYTKARVLDGDNGNNSRNVFPSADNTASGISSMNWSSNARSSSCSQFTHSPYTRLWCAVFRSAAESPGGDEGRASWVVLQQTLRGLPM